MVSTCLVLSSLVPVTRIAGPKCETLPQWSNNAMFPMPISALPLPSMASIAYRDMPSLDRNQQPFTLTHTE